MKTINRLQLFAAYGIELEYMLVDRKTLNVRPVADQVLATAAGQPTSDFESGSITWSNELALHVIELKGTQPASDLISLGGSLQQAIQQIQPALAAHNVVLLPTGMHPWMDPTTQTQLWPHESAEIYQAYHRVFNCFAHGWANVQSVHLNLPFADDLQFARLHAAARLILPILPALTASSPIVEQQKGPWRDSRMLNVRDHCQRIPFLTGQLIPEPIFDEATYRAEIFARLRELIEPHDHDRVFDPNFLNARGAIARFDRGSIELRVMDMQEYPAADVAICALVIVVLKALVREQWQPLESQKRLATAPLSQLLDQVSARAEETVIDDKSYLQQFGIRDRSISACDLWRYLLEAGKQHEPVLSQFQATLENIFRFGSLATRIERAIGDDYRHENLLDVYRQLSQCLLAGKPFLPHRNTPINR